MYSIIDDIFDSQELDFEVELAFVIGKTGKKIKVFLLSIERTFQALLLPKTCECKSRAKYANIYFPPGSPFIDLPYTH